MKDSRLVERLSLKMQLDHSLDLINEILDMRDLEIQDRDGRTLLINAAIYNRLDIVKLLIQRGASIHTQDNIGNTALHAAVLGDNIDVVRFLLENGANINEKNNFGNTPIWVAKPTQSKELFQVLLSYGADPKIENNYGVSAIDSMAAFPEILELLKSERLREGSTEDGSVC